MHFQMFNMDGELVPIQVSIIKHLLRDEQLNDWYNFRVLNQENTTNIPQSKSLP